MDWMSHAHAAYIWPAYLVAVLIIAGLIGFSLSAHARAKRKLAEMEPKTGERS